MLVVLRHSTKRHSRLGERVMMERMFRFFFLILLYEAYVCFFGPRARPSLHSKWLNLMFQAIFSGLWKMRI